MSNTDYIPKTDAEFHLWQANFISYASGKSREWNIPDDVFPGLENLQTTWDRAFSIAENPETRTTAAVTTKNNTKKLFKLQLRTDIKAYITYNPAVTDADRDNMKLPIHKTTRTPAPVAKNAPDFELDSSVLRRLTIHFFASSEKKSKAKPEGQHGVEIRWVISDTPVVNIENLLHSSFNTRSPFTLEFKGEDRGKTVYFALCWENTRGEKGPYSGIVSTIIP
jgi:hypothetical protein